MHISSSNTNNLYAKAGDTVTVTLNVTESVSNVTAIILDRNASFFIDADTINVTQNINTNDTNGPVTFDIYLNTTSNEIKHVTQDNLTVNIIIDTIKPVITINGNNLEFWMQNTAYSDAGSFVLDANNTSYQGTVYSNSSSLNASLLGIHLISYSADADQAGNIPDNKTRTVTVFNTDPYTISSLNTTSNNPNSHYAKVGDNIIISLQADKLIQNSRLFPFIVITGFIVSIIILTVRLSCVTCLISLDVVLRYISNVTGPFVSFVFIFCVTFIVSASIKNEALRSNIIAVTFDTDSVTFKVTVTVSPAFAYRLFVLELDMCGIGGIYGVFRSP